MLAGLKARAVANTVSSPLLSRRTIGHSALSLFAAIRRKRCQYTGRAEKDSAYVEEFFVSRASAVERIVLARRALMKEIEGASAGAFARSVTSAGVSSRSHIASMSIRPWRIDR